MENKYNRKHGREIEIAYEMNKWREIEFQKSKIKKTIAIGDATYVIVEYSRRKKKLEKEIVIFKIIKLNLNNWKEMLFSRESCTHNPHN